MAKREAKEKARATRDAETGTPEADLTEATEPAAADDATGGDGEGDGAALDDLDDLDEELGDLKDLLAEEGVDLSDSPDTEAVLDELDGLDDETGEGAASGSSGRDASRDTRRRTSRHSSERQRRSRDADAFRDLESQLSADPLDINVSEDGMTATVARIGEGDGPEDILAELKRQKIVAGIDEAAIEAATQRAANGAVQYDVVVAHGTPPETQAPAHVRYNLPEGLDTRGADTPLAQLKQVLSSPALEAITEWSGPCHLVRKGELLAEIVAAQAAMGMSVLGEEVAPEQGELPELVQTEHVVLSEDGLQCTAAVYGYAGMLEEGPAVVVPLWVSADNMEARFVCLEAGAPAPGEEELAEVLKARWIEHGVKSDNLTKIREALEQGKKLSPAVLVAAGTKPKAGKSGSVQSLVPPQQLPAWKQLQSLLNLRDRAGFEEGLAEMVSPERSVVFRAVSPGDAVAELQPAVQGTAGRDVLGEEIEAEEVEEAELEVGDFVTIDEDGLRARASAFGYLSLYGSAQVSIVPPLWMSGDHMLFGFLNLPQGETSKYPSRAEIDQLIEADGRMEGVQAEAWDDLLPRLEAGEISDPLVVIAEGVPAQAGRADAFEWAVKVGGRAGTIQEDGSIDLRDRQLITVVKEGDLIGRFIPGTPGESGRNVLGAELAPPALPRLDAAGDSRINAVPEGDEGVIEYHAGMDGGVTFTEESSKSRGAESTRLRLSLFAISEIDGDVDYSIGHVDFHGDVVIKGTVRALFQVKASGSVTIGENVEPGARIEAGGDILVSGGVLGESTELIAGGGVMAKFIQEAQVRAGGDVEVGAYIHEASVRTAGAIKVAGAGEGGGRALVGGLVWAGKGIEVPSLGSPSNPRIRVVAGIDPLVVEQTEELRGKIRACEIQERVALKVLGLRQLDVRAIRAKAKALEGEERVELLAQVARAAEYAELFHHLHGRLRELAESQRALARQASVAVGGPVTAGVEMRIGEYALKVTEDAANLTYHLVEEDGQVKLQADGA